MVRIQSTTATAKPPAMLCVGGSDPSAHAGVQVDVRVGYDLGVHPMTVLTCVTAQNSQTVLASQAVETTLYDQQWQSILADIEPNVVKIGLIPTVPLVKATAQWLKRLRATYPHCVIVLDPVVISSTGKRLQEADVLSHLAHEVFEWLDWFTPNQDELRLFAQACLPAVDVPNLSVAELMNQFQIHYPQWMQCHWVLKGGHGNGLRFDSFHWETTAQADMSIDWLYSPLLKTAVYKHLSYPLGFASPRQTVAHTRGTGCTFASALSSFLAHGYDALDALTLAKAYINQSLSQGYSVGKGAGPLGHGGWPTQLEHFPEIVGDDDMNAVVEKNEFSEQASSAFPALNADDLGLYPVLPSADWIARVLQQGVKTVQLRVKDGDPKTVSVEIQRAIALGQANQAKVFINDYWQLAIEYGAYGVHLGQEDMQTADLNAIRAAGLCLGISTHGYFEIAMGRAIQPSYLALGHIFPTQTKDMPSAPQGLQRLRLYSQLLKGHFPTVAIGGIGEVNLPDVLTTPVNSVALVTAITQSNDPEAATQRLLKLFSAKNQTRSASTNEEASA